MTTSVLLRAHVGVIGDAEVGKTALLKAFEKKHYFQQQYVMTQGAQLFVQVVHLDDGRQGERQTDAPIISPRQPQHEHAVELHLTEVGGHAIFAPMKDKYLTDCPYILACFDPTRRTTLDTVLTHYTAYKHHLTPPTTPLLALLVGCKSDRRADAEVGSEEAEERASEAGLGFGGYVECSAATGDGVEELFERIARHVAERNDEQNRGGGGVAAGRGGNVAEAAGDEEDGHTQGRAQPQQARQLNADDSDDD